MKNICLCADADLFGFESQCNAKKKKAVLANLNMRSTAAWGECERGLVIPSHIELSEADNMAPKAPPKEKTHPKVCFILLAEGKGFEPLSDVTR